jgi:hypothetical protein
VQGTLSLQQHAKDLKLSAIHLLQGTPIILTFSDSESRNILVMK